MQHDFSTELAREAPSARILIERMPLDQLDWRPHAKSRTLAELAWHMASVPLVVSTVIQNDRQERSQAPWPKLPGSAAAILAGFDSHIATCQKNLALIDDAAMRATFTMTNDGAELFAMPRAQFVRWGMVTHFVHHRAQLGLYLRILDVDVPALVGPSFDDNPFAPKK